MKKLPKFVTAAPMWVGKDNKNYKKYLNQLNKRGFSHTELWSLDYTIACFIYPRLKAFRAAEIGTPGCMFEANYDSGTKRQRNLASKKARERWNNILDKMIYSFEKYTKNNFGTTQEESDKIQEGLELFAKYFGALWS